MDVYKTYMCVYIKNIQWYTMGSAVEKSALATDNKMAYCLWRM